MPQNGRVSDRSAGDVDYDRLDVAYAQLRRTDPRIAARVHAALGDAATVVNVGAGAGSYEPSDRSVVAVEPSASMRAQRPADAAQVIAASAEQLPFADQSLDAAMAMVTIHQWPQLDRGLSELRRVARGPVAILTFDPAALQQFWLDDYWPELLASEARRFPSVDRVTVPLHTQTRVTSVPIPLDCTDGFLEAYYGRPESFLNPAVRAAQSSWTFIHLDVVRRGLVQLAGDLDSGRWDDRHAELRSQPERVGSLRLVVSG
jgi:SAM-dependent methyltransferase